MKSEITILLVILVIGLPIVEGYGPGDPALHPMITCVPYHDTHLVIMDLTCENNPIAISNYTMQGYEIKSATQGIVYMN
jgi:hypothetical protein